MNQLAVAIAIVLFPGLIAAVICDKIVVHAQRWDSFKYGVYSFLFGVLAYAALQGVVAGAAVGGYALLGLDAGRSMELSAWSLVFSERFTLNLFEVMWATAFAPFIAAVAAIIVNFKLINRLARRLRVSPRFGDENLYSFFLNDDAVRWVYVRDKAQDLVYVGIVKSFAQACGIQELLLAEVKVFDYETHSLQYAVEMAYLSRPMGSLVIEVPKPRPE